jgi:signal transduction histidine kinase
VRHTGTPRGSSKLRAASFDALRTERWVAVIRLAVVSIAIFTYLATTIGQQQRSWVGVTVLALATVYCLWSLVAFTGPAEPSVRARLLSVLVDVALVTALLVLAVGVESDYWALYLIVLTAVGLRFDLAWTLVASVAVALLYAGMARAEGELSVPLILHRSVLMVITGFAVGVLAQQRLVHRRRGQDLEVLAEERSQQLTEERAEVERLQRVDVAKSEFVAVAAHEFRTPLAAIIGVLSTLREHGSMLAPEERLELIDGASAQASRLARLVDDLLTVSRIEDGVLRLTLEPVDARRLLTEATQASGMVGRLVIQVGRVPAVSCDQDAIIRVLTNLLDNARKYSPADSKVHIAVSADGDLVRFSVRDEGPGIPEEERAEVFERFRRLTGGSAKPGAGLGLYICRGLVEAHGGSIEVGNAPEGGAEFTFTVPVATDLGEAAAVPGAIGPSEAATANGAAGDEMAEADAPSAAVR